MRGATIQMPAYKCIDVLQHIWPSAKLSRFADAHCFSVQQLNITKFSDEMVHIIIIIICHQMHSLLDVNMQSKFRLYNFEFCALLFALRLFIGFVSIHRSFKLIRGYQIRTHTYTHGTHTLTHIHVCKYDVRRYIVYELFVGRKVNFGTFTVRGAVHRNERIVIISYAIYIILIRNIRKL